MNNSVLSVIVPIYNVERYLPRCIDSIIAQTYKNLEIILVDDGSIDKSGQIADFYQKKDNRIKVIHKNNGGLSDARNTGIDNATGDYIAFVDSDDFVEPDIYEKSMEKIKNTNSDVLVFEIARDYSDKKSIIYKIEKEEVVDKTIAIIQLNTFKNIDYSACNKIFRKNLFTRIRFPLNKKCEDVYTMYKIFYNANKIYLYPYVGYHYCMRQGSITSSCSINMDFNHAQKEQMKFFKNDPVVADVSKSSYAYSCLTIVNIMISKGISDSVLLKKMRSDSKKYSKYVYKNKYLKFRKKFQFLIFDKLFLLYILILKYKNSKQ